MNSWHNIRRFCNPWLRWFLLLSHIVYSNFIFGSDDLYRFTQQDVQYLRQFALQYLPPPPTSPSNRFADNLAAAALGQQLFFDTRLSANRNLSCATCHQPPRYFSDGLQRSRGLATVRRNAPSILTAGYGPWKYWDGRKDSLWSQALAPLEDPHEHGLHRDDITTVIRKQYSDQYQSVFGNIDSSTTTDIFVNVGKAVMAYQRQLRLSPAPIDDFVQALESKTSIPQLQKIMAEEQVSGLRLFVGKAGCVSCHNGPLFTNFEFHNVGIPEADPDQVDLGRYLGIEQLRADEFNCLSPWSDAEPALCLELQYLKTQGPELVGAFKTPSLRNVAMTAPYMHSGQFETLEKVIAHYNKPTPPEYNREQHPSRPHFDILPLNLSDEEQKQLIAFLQSLTSPIPKNDPWWKEP
jgi:cytochrome c peroxidase